MTALSPSRRLAQAGLLISLTLLLSAFGCGSGGGNQNGGGTPAPTVPTFSASRAFADLTAQCDFGPRAPGAAGHAACRQWLLAQLQAATSDVTAQDFTYQAATGETFTFTNIVAGFPAGADFSDGILLGAHWDTRPVADRDPDPTKRDEPILGANDGASGVAVLLELARHFKQSPPTRPVVIALFDFEDGGLTPLTTGEPLSGFSIGARRFAAQPGRYRTAEAVVVDMVGDQHLSLPREPNSEQANPELVERIWSAAERLGFAAFQDRFGPAITDDHIPLIEVGIPAVDLIDFDYPGPNAHHLWHTTQDVPANCSAESLRVVGQTLLQTLYGS